MNLTLTLVISCYGSHEDHHNPAEMTTTSLIMFVILILIHLANVLLHSTGLYLLRSLRKRRGCCENQQLYIINLCVVELLISVINLLDDLVGLVPGGLLQNHVRFQVHHYLQIIIHTMLSVVLYACMILITIDKVLEIWLNVKYPLTCTIGKARQLMYCTWLTGILMFILAIVFYIVCNFDHHAVNEYLFLIADFLFIATAIASYTLIFYKYKQTRTQPSLHRGGSNQSTPGVIATFMSSRFYISLLLIASFLLFMIVPDFIYAFTSSSDSFHDHCKRTGSSLVEQIMSMLYGLSFLCDAGIYIMMQPSVRQLLWRKIYRTRLAVNLFSCSFRKGARNRKRAVTDVTRYDTTPV